MRNFVIEPEILVRDGPRLHSIAEAVEFARQMVDQRSFDVWKDTLRRLEAVNTEEDAIEAAGALREVLETEDLLMPAKDRRHTTARVNKLSLERSIIVRGNPDRVVRTTQEAALVVRELLTQRPDPRWQAVLEQLEAARTAEDVKRATAAMCEILEAEHLLV